MNEQSNFELGMESIGQALFEMFDINTPKPVKALLSNVKDSYILVEFPESQEFMDEESAIFCGGSEEKTGSSAYFVPIELYLSKISV